MNNMFLEFLKCRLESLFKCKIYRNTLPRGTDLFKDMSAVIASAKVRSVIDIGANVGQSISTYLNAFPKAAVLGIEPCSEHYEFCVKQFGGTPRVALRRLAMSDRNGEVVLHLNKFGTTHSLIDKGGSIGEETVTAKTLDSLCDTENIKHINFCKIDTEGHDFAVLRGANKLLAGQAIDFIQVETSVRHDIKYFSGFHEIDSYMASMKYELFGIYEQQKCWTGRNSLLYFNAVYIRSSLVDEVAPVSP